MQHPPLKGFAIQELWSTVYARILVDSHISQPLKISVKMMIFDQCNNVIIVMRV